MQKLVDVDFFCCLDFFLPVPKPWSKHYHLQHPMLGPSFLPFLFLSAVKIIFDHITMNLLWKFIDLSTYLWNVSLTLLIFTLGHYGILLPDTKCPSWSPYRLFSLLCYAYNLILVPSSWVSAQIFTYLKYYLLFPLNQFRNPLCKVFIYCIHQAFSKLSVTFSFSPFWNMHIDPYQKCFYIIVTIGIVFYLLFLRTVEQSPWSSYSIWQASFWQHHLTDVGTAK